MLDKVSVLIPVYNAGRYLRPALTSIASQSYHNLEIIAIDDGSKDESSTIIEEFASGDHRFKYITRENRGLVATLNEGLQLSTGTYIARMDADDIAYKDRIDQQVRFMNAHPEIDLLAMNADYLYNDGILIRKPTVEVGSADIRTESMFHCMFIHPTVMLRSATLREKGWVYNLQFPYCEDFELWSRIASEGLCHKMAEIGLSWRQGHASVRSNNRNDAVIDSFAIVQSSLRRRGIEVDLLGLFPLLDEKGLMSRACADLVAENFRVIRAAKHRFARTAAAYDRGVEAFARNLRIATVGIRNPTILEDALLARTTLSSVRSKSGIRKAINAIDHTVFKIRSLAVIKRLNRLVSGTRLKETADISEDVRRLL